MAGKEGIAAVFEKDMSRAAQDEIDFQRFVGVPVAQIPPFVGQGDDNTVVSGRLAKG